MSVTLDYYPDIVGKAVSGHNPCNIEHEEIPLICAHNGMLAVPYTNVSGIQKKRSCDLYLDIFNFSAEISMHVIWLLSDRDLQSKTKKLYSYSS